MQVPYYELLVEFPFKGDETPLRNMEQAELITIGTYNGEQHLFLSLISKCSLPAAGRPSIIRPGKPVYKYVFEQLVSGMHLFSPLSMSLA
jgi:hypothetical protein